MGPDAGVESFHLPTKGVIYAAKQNVARLARQHLSPRLSLVNTASAQHTRPSTEVKNFEVVSVDGNKVVVKGEQGAQEITVPDDFGSPSTARASPCASCGQG